MPRKQKLSSEDIDKPIGSSQRTEHQAFRKSLRITMIYFLFGCLWIITTDQLSGTLFFNSIVMVNIIKGLFYVLVTAILIFGLIYPALKKVIVMQENMQKVNQQLEQANSDLYRDRQKLLDSELKLRESEKLFRTIFDQAPIGIAIGRDEQYVVSMEDDLPGINPMFEKITGRTKEEWTDKKWTDILYSEGFGFDEHFGKLQAGTLQSYDIERRYMKPDGSEVWLHAIIAPLNIDDNSKYNNFCLIEDITGRKSTEEALFESERSKAVLLDNLPGMAYRCKYDRDRTMWFVSGGCYELTGYKAERLLFNREKSYFDLIAPKYKEYLWDRWCQVLREKSKLIEEYEIATATGETKWVWEQGQGIYDEYGNALALESLVIDITQRKQHEMMLKYMNDHDMLTGLHNRIYFQEFITRDLKNSVGETRAVLLVNLRKFSLLNTTFGFTFGENLIKELAASLLTLNTSDCRLFHISIDRFVFYVKNYENRNRIVELCDTIIGILNSAFASKIIGGNIGVVEIDPVRCNAESVLKNASIAARNVDENMDFGYSFFNREMAEKISRKTEIKDELTKAAYDPENDGLYLLYQPIVDLKTNQISGFEALARFRSEKQGIISPVEFIPIAEESQLIVPLGKKIMRIAFDFLKRLESRGYDHITVSLNVSAIQLLRDDFIPDLTEVIKETGVDPYKLEIEITESIFSNNYYEINKKLDRIKEMGLKIAIDDFGTGYSSLARERELNINCLKIDKYFIDKLIDLDADKAITGDIISMAHKLGHYVVAEGVEDPRQKQYLISHNCDYMQGYLFSKPVSAERAFEILST